MNRQNLTKITYEIIWNLTAHLALQYIPRNVHMVFALLYFVVVIHWLIFPYPSGLLHWHCGNLTIAPVPAKQPWWIWINTSCEIIMKDCITTTKQSTTKPCAYFLEYTVCVLVLTPDFFGLIRAQPWLFMLWLHARSSGTMILIVQDKQCVAHTVEGFQC